MLQPVDVNEYGDVISSVSGAPGLGPGVTVTPGNNTYGSYVSVLSAVASDVWGLWILITNGFVSAAARDMIVTIGLDAAGGTSFTDFIVDLLAPCPGQYGTSAAVPGGIAYWFPLFIKAGTSIGAKASVNNATVGTVAVGAKCMIKPSRPDLIRVGHYVRTYGSTPASSSGTAVTPGTASEGAWTQLGTVAAGDRPWFWQVGLGINNAAMNSGAWHIDLGIGDASNKRTPIVDQFSSSASTECISANYAGAFAKAVPGDLVYGRAQQSSTLMTGFSMAAYAVGG
jgi:hypothetical protein